MTDTIQLLKDYVPPWVALIANLATICTFVFAIYFYLSKRDKISQVYQVLVGLKNQESFRELTRRLDHLDRLNFDVKEHRPEATYLLAEILGQLKSNSVLAHSTADVRVRLQLFVSGSEKIGETSKRQICSELRESLRNLNYETISRLTEGDKK